MFHSKVSLHRVRENTAFPSESEIFHQEEFDWVCPCILLCRHTFIKHFFENPEISKHGLSCSARGRQSQALVKSYKNEAQPLLFFTG